MLGCVMRIVAFRLGGVAIYDEADRNLGRVGGSE